MIFICTLTIDRQCLWISLFYKCFGSLKSIPNNFGLCVNPNIKRKVIGGFSL